MGMTGTEKILARASGKLMVRPGEIVFPNPDVVFVHDLMIAPSKAQLDGLGIKELFDADRVVFATDHTVIYTTPQEVARGAATRKAADEWRVKRFFDVGQGGMHTSSRWKWATSRREHLHSLTIYIAPTMAQWAQWRSELAVK